MATFHKLAQLSDAAAVRESVQVKRLAAPSQLMFCIQSLCARSWAWTCQEHPAKISHMSDEVSTSCGAKKAVGHQETPGKTDQRELVLCT